MDSERQENRQKEIDFFDLEQLQDYLKGIVSRAEQSRQYALERLHEAKGQDLVAEQYADLEEMNVIVDGLIKYFMQVNIPNAAADLVRLKLDLVRRKKELADQYIRYVEPRDPAKQLEALQELISKVVMKVIELFLKELKRRGIEEKVIEEVKWWVVGQIDEVVKASLDETKHIQKSIG